MGIHNAKRSYLARVLGVFSRLVKWIRAPEASEVAHALSLASGEVVDRSGMTVLLPHDTLSLLHQYLENMPIGVVSMGSRPVLTNDIKKRRQLLHHRHRRRYSREKHLKQFASTQYST